MRLPKALLVLSLLQIGYSQQNVEEQVSLAAKSSSYDNTLEAQKVYQQALSALNSLAASEAAARYASTSTARGPITAALRWLKLKSRWRGKSKTGRPRTQESIGGDEGQALKVIDLLGHAIELGSVEALYTLGEISLFPPSQHVPLNASRAFNAYSRHAFITGNSTSHSRLGFFYASGYGGATEVDQKRALLEWTFAAHGEKGDGNGNKYAQMALGYRYWMGIGVNEDCMTALEWYEAAAEKSLARFLMGPPGGKTLPLSPIKLSDLAGGAYGYGSSASSTGFLAGRAVIKSVISRNAGETVEDLVEYLEFNADRNDLHSIYRLGKMYYQGSVYAAPGGIASGSEGVSLVPKDMALARSYFMKAARQIWVKDTPNQPLSGRREPKSRSKSGKGEKASDGEDKEREIFASHSAGYLGRMYLRGEGVRQDFKLARMWFERGAESNDRESLNGLGIMWRDGLIEGSKADSLKAGEYFNFASNQDLAEAQLNLGKHYYARGDLNLASQFFEAAVRNGSPFEAYHYIAEIHAANARDQLPKGASTQLAMTPAGSCAVATSFFKVVAERGCWDEELVREGNALWERSSVPLGVDRNKEEALLRWLIAAEAGIEAAQNNVAFVLDQDKSSLRNTRFASLGPHKPIQPDNLTSVPLPRVALTYWTRSAAQRNVDALVKVGDYYYKGIGLETFIDNETEQERGARLEKAVGYYQSAVDTQVSALAMWKLGWMYENGVGVPQDFHLAKRYYDLALETNSEAYLPVVLSLIKLHLRSLWHALTGGSQKEKILLLWSDELDGDGWYLGKSKADMKKRRDKDGAEDESIEGEENDLIEWARRNKDEEATDSDLGPDDYFDAATRGRSGENMDEDDEWLETFVLVGLCVLVATLMYVRARWVDRQRADDERAREGANNVVQPQPGDPAFDLLGLLQ